MPLYCYIVETGMYEDVEAHILGHPTKFSQEEFDNICIKLTEKYGDVEEIEYTVPANLDHVEEIRYKIDSYRLIKLLIRDYGFIELDVPINDGFNTKEVSREPVPPERLRKVTFKPQNKCPVEDMFTCTNEESDFQGVFDQGFKHPNARCIPPFNDKPTLKRR